MASIDKYYQLAVNVFLLEIRVGKNGAFSRRQSFEALDFSVETRRHFFGLCLLFSGSLFTGGVWLFISSVQGVPFESS